MKKYILIIALMPLILLASPFHTKKQIKQISSSVIKIYTTSVKADYFRPWQKGYSNSSSGTGVIIADNLILTAAHVVSDGTFIQVKKSNDSKKHTAKVKWIDHEADLALVQVSDKHFFDNMIPQSFGKLPYRQDGVVVYGYPVGGDEISTTQGIVSRIEQRVYSHSYMDHIAIQIDALIGTKTVAKAAVGTAKSTWGLLKILGKGAKEGYEAHKKFKDDGGYDRLREI